MRAAVLREHGEPLDVTEVEAPDPAPRGAVVAVEACGICRSDWHGWQGEWGWLGLEDVSDKLAAMTDFETEGIPVVDSF